MHEAADVEASATERTRGQPTASASAMVGHQVRQVPTSANATGTVSENAKPTYCPGRKPPNRVVKRPAGPYKAPYKTDLLWRTLRRLENA